jgi:hypothetical protein
MKLIISRESVVTCLCICLARGATIANFPTAGPAAIATIAQATYCFTRPRGLDPGRLPPAYLVLRLQIRVSYRNSGTRPLILPLGRDRTVYTALKPGAMSIFQSPGLFDPANNLMKDLPADVSPDSPVSPKTDVFSVIPARGEMTPPLLENVTLPVDRKALFKTYPDLRGRRVYLRLQFAHQKLSSALEADLSDRWAPFGVPWTGTLLTNTFVIDVPRAPQGLPCTDVYTPADRYKTDSDNK